MTSIMKKLVSLTEADDAQYISTLRAVLYELTKLAPAVGDLAREAKRYTTRYSADSVEWHDVYASLEQAARLISEAHKTVSKLG